MKVGILILSHRGFSFVEDLSTKIRGLGREVYILASKPETQHEVARQAAINGLADHAIHAGKDALEDSDVASALAVLASSGRHVEACISVWDGYRTLMATANAQLGARDVSPSVVRKIVDKLAFRTLLHECGLSSVTAEALTPKVLDRLQLTPLTRRFVKPRRGLASFAAFEWTPGLTWAEVEGLHQSMLADGDYQGLAREGGGFLVEDYIAGKEFSFEVVVVGSRPFFLGIHEKWAMAASGKTTLEHACVAPASNLTPAAASKGMQTVAAALNAFAVTEGCYHIEARYSPLLASWELIEINPRVGGAFINQSVAQLSGGPDLLDLWLASLVIKTNEARVCLQQKLQPIAWRCIAAPLATSFFRVFFGHPGRSIAQIARRDEAHPATIFKVLATAGQVLPQAEREIFLGQALWRMPPATRASALAALEATSLNALEVRYA